jgi:hypothetical protein
MNNSMLQFPRPFSVSGKDDARHEAEKIYDALHADDLAAQLRSLAARLDSDYEAEAALLELAQDAEKAPPAEPTSVSFVSAGTDRTGMTLIVSPRVAAIVMDLLETLAVERDSNRDIA